MLNSKYTGTKQLTIFPSGKKHWVSLWCFCLRYTVRGYAYTLLPVDLQSLILFPKLSITPLFYTYIHTCVYIYIYITTCTKFIYTTWPSPAFSLILFHCSLHRKCWAAAAVPEVVHYWEKKAAHFPIMSRVAFRTNKKTPKKVIGKTCLAWIRGRQKIFKPPAKYDLYKLICFLSSKPVL